MRNYGNKSLFGFDVAGINDFMDRYKALIEEKNRWPSVSIGYYQNRNNIATDLRYFRLANELIISKDIHPIDAMKIVYSKSTNDLDHNEYQWSVLVLSGAICKSDSMMPRDD